LHADYSATERSFYYRDSLGTNSIDSTEWLITNNVSLCRLQWISNGCILQWLRKFQRKRSVDLSLFSFRYK
jgi:hypothetical protein